MGNEFRIRLAKEVLQRAQERHETAFKGYAEALLQASKNGEPLPRWNDEQKDAYDALIRAQERLDYLETEQFLEEDVEEDEEVLSY